MSTDSQSRGLPARSSARGAGEPLLYLPRLLLGALEDIHTIADSVRQLPQLAQTLASIDDAIGALNAEVTRMRKGVDHLGEEVVGVRESVAPLDERMDAVREQVTGLEPYLAQVRDAVGPLRGTAERLGRMTARLPRGRRPPSP